MGETTRGDDADGSAGSLPYPAAAAADVPTERLPAWATRHLAESERSPVVARDASTAGASTPGATAPGATATARHRHRRPRRRRPTDDSPLRGWGVAAVALAAATATVPLAWAALGRDAAPLPQIGTFPAVAPQELGERGDAGTARFDPVDAGTRSAPGPDVAGVLPPFEHDEAGAGRADDQGRGPRFSVPEASGPVVMSEPDVRSRAARPPAHRHGPPRSSTPTTTTTTGPEPGAPGPDPGDGRDLDPPGGSDESSEPPGHGGGHDGEGETGSGTGSSGSSGRHGDRQVEHRSGGLLGAVTRTASDLLN